MATRGILLAKEAVKRGTTITVRWIPGHAGVPGNEIADQWASEAAVREQRCRMGREGFGTPGPIHLSWTFLKTVLKKWATAKWEEIVSRCKGRRTFRIPREGETPRIPLGLGRAPWEVAARFFQLVSGHAMIAPFLKEKFRWINSDSCWCDGGRQSREHLFKECKTWKEEIKVLWKEVGEIAGCKEQDKEMYRKDGKVSASAWKRKMYDLGIFLWGNCFVRLQVYGSGFEILREFWGRQGERRGGTEE